MFLGRQPRQQRRMQAGALAGFGEDFLHGDETIVLRRQHQGPIQIQHTAAQRAAAGITETSPDFVQRHAEFVVTATIGTDQSPTQLCRFDASQIAEHPVTRLFAGTQTFGGVEKTDQATTFVPDVEKHFQTVPRQAFKPRVTAFETNLPDTAQRIRQALAGDIRHIE
ncbi:hypothetical protein D3C87_1469070 [compost metagenome]